LARLSASHSDCCWTAGSGNTTGHDQPDIEDALTHFERKYIENGVALFELQVCGAMPFPASNI